MELGYGGGEEVVMTERGFSPGLAFTEAVGALAIGVGIVSKDPQTVVFGSTVASIPFAAEFIAWRNTRKNNGKGPDKNSDGNQA